MEAAYKQTRERKRQVLERAGRERRSVIQLIVSIMLFLLVFVGRGVFPGVINDLDVLLAEDSDFRSAFLQLEEDIAKDESVWSALHLWAVTVLQGESAVQVLPETEKEDPPEDGPEIVLLSDSEGHGISYLRNHGIRTNVKHQAGTEEQPPEVEIVTAVAQPYNAEGVALPANVSYEYYEFGLEKTVCPVKGETTSGFDYRVSPITGKREFHLALDIAADTGTDIFAFADGVVRYIGESDDFGLYFMIDHDNGVSTFYAHCSKLMVRKGETVSCGQVVALVGETGKTTGPHLHFTIEKDNIRLDPAYYVDPSQK